MINRRKTRSKRQGEKFNVGGAWVAEEKEIKTQATPEISENPTPKIGSTDQSYDTKSVIDQIRSELCEEKSAPPIEPEYQDESHSWGAEYEIESDDYWHFVGRYE